MRYKIRTLLVITTLTAILAWWCRDWLHNPYGNDAPALLLAPIQTSITVRPGGDVYSNRMTYSVGNYAISEFGHVRLAVEGMPFSGRSTSSILLASKSATVGASSGGTGVGNRRFEYQTIAGGSNCRFAGLSFDIVRGQLELLGDSFPVDDEPILIVVDSQGEIDALVELPREAPASGTASQLNAD